MKPPPVPPPKDEPWSTDGTASRFCAPKPNAAEAAIGAGWAVAVGRMDSEKNTNGDQFGADWAGFGC